MPVSLSFPTVRFCSSGHRAIPWTRRASIAAAFRPELWRGRRIAPTREGPRNELSNRAHDSTSGRSTHYASGHLIRVFHGIGHIFSSLYPFHWRSCCLVALAPRCGTCYFAPNICSVMPLPMAMWFPRSNAICGAGAVARDCFGGNKPGQGWGASLARASVSRADQTSAFSLCMWERCCWRRHIFLPPASSGRYRLVAVTPFRGFVR